MKGLKFLVAACAMAASFPVSAQVTVDVSGLPESKAKALISLLNVAGIQRSGTVRENATDWCVFNDWKARDKKAQIANKFNQRFSLGNTLGGRWYCFQK